MLEPDQQLILLRALAQPEERRASEVARTELPGADTLASELAAGGELSATLDGKRALEHPVAELLAGRRYLPAPLIELITRAERQDALDDCLRRLAREWERRQRLRRQLRSALILPAVIGAAPFLAMLSTWWLLGGPLTQLASTATFAGAEVADWTEGADKFQLVAGTLIRAVAVGGLVLLAAAALAAARAVPGSRSGGAWWLIARPLTADDGLAALTIWDLARRLGIGDREAVELAAELAPLKQARVQLRGLATALADGNAARLPEAWSMLRSLPPALRSTWADAIARQADAQERELLLADAAEDVRLAMVDLRCRARLWWLIAGLLTVMSASHSNIVGQLGRMMVAAEQLF